MSLPLVTYSRLDAVVQRLDATAAGNTRGT